MAEYNVRIREAMLAMLDAHERAFGADAPGNATLLAQITAYEAQWFPGDITTAQMRKKYKEAVRLGLIH